MSFLRRPRRREAPPQHEIAPPEYPSGVLACLPGAGPAGERRDGPRRRAGGLCRGRTGNRRAPCPGCSSRQPASTRGGVVLNDVFDRERGRGRATRTPAAERARCRPAARRRWEPSSSSAGVLTAALGTGEGGRVALAIAASVLLYDGWSKKNPVLGPVNMGACRGLNLGLGMAAVPGTLAHLLAAVPDSHGIHCWRHPAQQGRGLGRPALVGDLVARACCASIAALSFVAIEHGSARLARPRGDRSVRRGGSSRPSPRPARPSPPGPSEAAVKRGVLSLVLLDAALATAFVGIGYGLVLLAAALGALWLGRTFSVT